jgi:hypothetical protein
MIPVFDRCSCPGQSLFLVGSEARRRVSHASRGLPANHKTALEESPVSLPIASSPVRSILSSPPISFSQPSPPRPLPLPGFNNIGFINTFLLLLRLLGVHRLPSLFIGATCPATSSDPCRTLSQHSFLDLRSTGCVSTTSLFPPFQSACTDNSIRLLILDNLYVKNLGCVA